MAWIKEILIIIIGGFAGYYILIALGNEHRANMMRFFLILMIAISTLDHAGPALGRIKGDYEEVHRDVTNLTGALNTVGVGVDAVTSWPETKESMPYVGTNSSTHPPAITIMEKLRPSTIRFSLPVAGIITQEYKGNDHHGIDFACDEGSEVVAVRGGKVAFTNSDKIYGNHVMIDHSGGWQTLYAHLSKVSIVEGQEVKEGVQLGLSGNTGNSTGPHLHMELRVGGQARDPKPYFK